MLAPRGTEAQADAAVSRELGIRVGYDRRWPGRGLQYAKNPSDTETAAILLVHAISPEGEAHARAAADTFVRKGLTTWDEINKAIEREVELLGPLLEKHAYRGNPNGKALRFTPEEYNYYVNWVMNAVLGRLSEADALMADYGGAIRRMAKKLRRHLGVPVRPVWRGLQIEPEEVPPNRMLSQGHGFSSVSWSEDKDVACWFADRDSQISRFMRMIRPGAVGWLAEIVPKKDDVLFHWSWADRFPDPRGPWRSASLSQPGRSFSLVSLSAIHPEIHTDQLAWALKSQKEVILRPLKRKVKVIAYDQGGCPPTADLDQRLIWGEADWIPNPDPRERELERAWKAGDPQAGVAFLVALRRRGPQDLEEERLMTALVEAVGSRTGNPRDLFFTEGRRELRRVGSTLPDRPTLDESHEVYSDYSGSWEIASTGNWLVVKVAGAWQEERWGDRPYQVIWSSEPLLAFVSVTEGDLGIELAKSYADWIDLYDKKVAFYGEGGIPTQANPGALARWAPRVLAWTAAGAAAEMITGPCVGWLRDGVKRHANRFLNNPD